MHGPGKILIAEDDPEARELLLLFLGGTDYRLLQAADGSEALELVRKERPDLLITDIVMPRMDGYELVRRLRQDEATARMPVIFCSASYHEREVRAMAQALGVFTTLSKPFDAAAVKSAAASALLGSRGMPGMARGSSPFAERATAAQARLSELVAFSRKLFVQNDAAGILQVACLAARDILLAQCAELAIHGDEGNSHRCVENGLSEEAYARLVARGMYRDLLATVEAGGCAQYPMSPPEPTPAEAAPASEFVSMLGVPIASPTRRYGYLVVLNRIALSGFSEEDVGIARAIAAQVAVAYENALRHEALEQEVVQRCLAEERVRQLNLDLEQLVAQRTAELQIANRELEAFSYSVAHDLRAPLRLIDAYVQMLKEDWPGLLTAQASRHLERIQQGAANMSVLIDGLLALSRVSHAEMRQEKVALSEVLEEARAQLDSQAGDRAVDWRIAPLPAVDGDPELLRLAFFHLLGNALKYTGRRPRAVIEVGTGAREGEPYIYVRDNGVGFDMRYAGKLFGLFQRLHHQNEFEGTGIGLAAVSRIVERHRGRIWAESAPERGATFCFTLAGLQLPPTPPTPIVPGG